jgi:hypothetical protein
MLQHVLSPVLALIPLARPGNCSKDLEVVAAAEQEEEAMVAEEAMGVGPAAAPEVVVALVVVAEEVQTAAPEVGVGVALEAAALVAAAPEVVAQVEVALAAAETLPLSDAIWPLIQSTLLALLKPPLTLWSNKQSSITSELR